MSTSREKNTPCEADKIASIAARLRQNFDQPLHVEDFARELGMSVSSLHHRFKAVTALSPLQFQKRLQLQHVRRLMLEEDRDSASAAYRVGYQDASHFNREYKSLFGLLLCAMCNIYEKQCSLKYCVQTAPERVACSC